MKKFLSRCSTLGVILLLTSCATTYGPKGITGGYSEIQMDETTFQVFFEGNQQTTREQVGTQLMFRCSELTIQHGYSHFMILSDESIEKQDSQSGQANVSISKGMGAMVNTRVEVEQPTSNIIGVYTIKMLAKPDPVYASASVNAMDFMKKNQHQIKRKK